MLYTKTGLKVEPIKILSKNEQTPTGGVETIPIFVVCKKLSTYDTGIDKYTFKELLLSNGGNVFKYLTRETDIDWENIDKDPARFTPEKSPRTATESITIKAPENPTRKDIVMAKPVEGIESIFPYKFKDGDKVRFKKSLIENRKDILSIYEKNFPEYNFIDEVFTVVSVDKSNIELNSIFFDFVGNSSKYYFDTKCFEEVKREDYK